AKSSAMLTSSTRAAGVWLIAMGRNHRHRGRSVTTCGGVLAEIREEDTAALQVAGVFRLLAKERSVLVFDRERLGGALLVIVGGRASDVVRSSLIEAIV